MFCIIRMGPFDPVFDRPEIDDGFNFFGIGICTPVFLGLGIEFLDMETVSCWGMRVSKNVSSLAKACRIPRDRLVFPLF